MPTFAYEILDEGGRQASGRLEAPNQGSAAARLRENGARILSLQSVAPLATNTAAPSGLRHWIGAKIPPSATDRIQAFSHLSMMLRAGLSLSQALHLIVPETPRFQLRVALQDVATQIESGKPFSAALATHPKFFPGIVVSIISSSEESGEMADGLDRVCHHWKFWAELKQKMVQALTYPSIVIVLAIVVTVILVTVFIPKVEAFVTKGGRALPPVTQFLFDVAHFFQGAWPWLLGSTLLIGLGIFLGLKKEPFRLGFERTVLKLPLLGGTWRSALLARGCGLLAVLLQSGTSLVRSLEISAETLGSLHFRALFLNAAESVMRGLSLRQSLAQPGVPGSMLGVIAAGEESGDLPRAFGELETHYATRLSARMLMMATLIEPALILFVGGIVAVVYMALFSAVISLVR